MTKFAITVFTVFLALWMLQPCEALAGEMADALHYVMTSKSPDDFIKIVIALQEEAPLDELKAVFRADHTLKAERHQIVINSLQETARESQTNILTELEIMKAAGDVESYRSFWIANMIGVKIKARAIDRLALRSDVRKVYFDYPIEGIQPVDENPSTPGATTGSEEGLRDLNAHLLWAMGINGEGSIVCNLDTGVQGSHSALAGRWRGLDPGVQASAAWFDPVTSTNFPFDAGSHGTHTMGTMTGMVSGDTVGMAWGAKWIAAGVIDRVSIQQTITDAILAFQWAADPDGNPATEDDVPDVVSNSWGLHPDFHPVSACDDIFDAAIQGTEAAGAVVVFAAGNEGSNGLRVPAERINSPVDVYSVGALNAGSQTVASFSSRGPSRCPGSDEERIKPEVSARGVSVRSTVPGGYGTMSGTSMAAPHVAGAVALLRQVAPEAPVDDIKWALMLSAVDIDAPGEDNNTGWGRIDVFAAMEYLGASISVGGFMSPPGTQGVEVSLSLANDDTMSLISFLLTEEPEAFDVVDLTLNIRAAGFDATITDSGDGSFITISSSTGDFILPGDGDLGYLTIDISPAAPGGEFGSTQVSGVTFLDEYGNSLAGFGGGSGFVIGMQYDLNADGTVDILDIIGVINYILGRTDEFTPYQFWAVDGNFDGEINIFDVILIIGEVIGGFF